MNPLKKTDRKRFSKLCKRMRQMLLLEGKSYLYEFLPDDEMRIASCLMVSEGWRVHIQIMDRFWTLSGEEQLRVLLHEHIHATMIPYDQRVNKLDLKSVEYQHLVDGRELVVTHLEDVFTRLFK